jgi:hypothetical protein
MNQSFPCRHGSIPWEKVIIVYFGRFFGVLVAA